MSDKLGRYVVEFVDGMRLNQETGEMPSIRIARVYRPLSPYGGWPKRSDKPILFGGDSDEHLLHQIEFWAKLGYPAAKELEQRIAEYSTAQVEKTNEQS